MNASIVFWAQSELRTLGGSWRITGLNDHSASAAWGSPAGWPQAAPLRTQVRSASTSEAGNGPVGGIFSAPLCSTAATKTLSDGLPGTTLGPRLPPRSIASREVIASPPLATVSLWQL